MVATAGIEAHRNGSYGIDAPYLLPIPLLLIAINVCEGIVSRTPWPFLAALLVTACAGLGLYASGGSPTFNVGIGNSK